MPSISCHIPTLLEKKCFKPSIIYKTSSQLLHQKHFRHIQSILPKQFHFIQVWYCIAYGRFTVHPCGRTQ